MKYYEHSVDNFTPDVKLQKLPSVYVLTTHDFGFIKIGKSSALKQRMINIQSGCPFDLHLWLTIRTPKPSEIESFLHSKLCHCSVRGEWFSPLKNDIDYLLSFFSETNRHIASIHKKANVNINSGGKS